MHNARHRTRDTAPSTRRSAIAGAASILLLAAAATAMNGCTPQDATHVADDSAASPAGSTFDPTPVVIDGSTVRTFVSDEGRVHRAYIWSPPDPPPARGRPVVYVLDGETTFLIVRDVARSLADAYTDADLPIIVALGYDNAAPYSREGLTRTLSERTLDYTPAVAQDRLGESLDGAPWPATGGADDFLAFIENTLKPAIAADHPIDRDRQVLMGHSFGGLLTLHAFLEHPERFNTFVASSPSVWFGKHSVLARARQFAASGDERLDGKRLLVTVGGLEQSRAPARGENGRAQWLSDSRMVDGVRELVETLQPLRARGLSLESREYPRETHLSVKPAAINYGVRFALATTTGGELTAVTEAPAAHAATSYPQYSLPGSARLQVEMDGTPYAATVLLPVFPASLEVPAAGYPTVYVLGSDAHLGIYADTLRRLEGPGVIAPAIVVGLPYHTDAAATTDAPAMDATQLLALIESAIDPALRARYRLDPARRSLVGHGDASRIVIEDLYGSAWFDTLVAISPSIDAIESAREREEAFTSGRNTGTPTADRERRLLVVVGDDTGNDYPGALQGGTDASGIPDTAIAWLERLRPLSSRGLASGLRWLPGEDNVLSTTAFSEALLFALGQDPSVRAYDAIPHP